MGADTETISRFERGYAAPPLFRLFELAALYGVPPETPIAGGEGRSLGYQCANRYVVSRRSRVRARVGGCDVRAPRKG
ncbi:helix-turn-helix domain-containing protein [Burkholderia pyrrocinia]|uniref:helix-turn-helix domain-containing protein n=1 Tax=Burkholderia pyrrocinia TaxID=60550 RepID=UPI0039EEB48E